MLSSEPGSAVPFASDYYHCGTEQAIKESGLSYTIADVAAHATDVTGKSIEVIQLSDQALKAHLLAAGIPEPSPI
jgi:hypothetical protein